ncbi:MAG: T9SS type A sorting domain-containing protein [Candidatus Marinimicrobia bacterium]|jgi:hypothetical protein|nr:T9SS type A sorting domain-containing protein [Candidatus Neomarinimicrobiota bacterium]MBT4069414.1 T9SS type A sorting domain-containing protein [Candidatus Neomarinimicrobiota bacterium]MBT4271466.1 T9SS type A sorting domain-containing protein [Candidatus Neomarinimicrobiota bacterium]MBT7115186.1 T9SS type A sorting domain-containing protein [Candidatus Neomarinimicrobiota bacterium]MBT7495366.1 T9SS type A sorting domain-containing protein [Candidatus Neomarinimicrobiota bacterium]
MAIDEGIADYFASAITLDPQHGYLSIFPQFITTRERSLQNNLKWFGEELNPYSDVHILGTIIGGACWDLRGLIGDDSFVNELVFDALQYEPLAFTFEQFADNIALADDNDGNIFNGTPNYASIKQAFQTNHGIPVVTLLSTCPTCPATPTGLSMTNQGSIMQNPQLTWNGSSDATSYNIYRCEGYYNPCTFQVIGSTSNTSFIDFGVFITSQAVATGNYIYRVKAVNSNGMSSYSNIVSTWGETFLKMRDEITSINEPIPGTYALNANYPNPFNPTTTIKYELPVASSVTLVIYDLRGNEVTRWTNGYESAGYKRKTWDATDKNGNKVPAGIYLLKMTAESKESHQIFTETRKMVLLK